VTPSERQAVNTRPDLVPTKLEHITPEWLNAFLGSRTPAVQVDDLEILDRTQGAATRLRVRVRYADGADGGLPEVLFIKTSLTRQMLVADTHMYLTEVYFYDRIRPKIDFETPAVYACEIDEETNRFAVVIEDIAQRSARFPGALSGLTGAELMPLMSTLAGLHAANWGGSDLESRFPWLESSTTGKTATWWTSDEGRQNFQIELGEDYKREAVDPERNPVDRMWKAFERLQTASDTAPRTVVHGDVHIANTYQLPVDFGLLDWQLMRIANWANDVSYPTVTALSVAERRASERDLLRHYLAELSARGVEAPSWDSAWLAYRQQALWGVVTWTITPTAMYSRELLDALIRRAVTAVDDLDTYAALGQ
jgi:aminoglycoside phosphotransferase (APT) family kinase protein